MISERHMGLIAEWQVRCTCGFYAGRILAAGVRESCETVANFDAHIANVPGLQIIAVVTNLRW